MGRNDWEKWIISRVDLPIGLRRSKCCLFLKNLDGDSDDLVAISIANGFLKSRIDRIMRMAVPAHRFCTRRVAEFSRENPRLP
ncbi:MAG TPA: hypothetical protein VLA12_09180, partial [Planctomycetaceae bacterium]|nr:hypothetical protein [Planctomycetaceae bacterium]